MGGSRAGSAANDEFADKDQAAAGLSCREQAIEQKVHRLAASQRAMGVDGRKWRIGRGRNDIVTADDAEVLGHGQAAIGKAGDHALGDDIVDGQCSSRPGSKHLINAVLAGLMAGANRIDLENLEPKGCGRTFDGRGALLVGPRTAWRADIG